MIFLFKTTTTIKEQDNGKWWVDKNLIPNTIIHAESINKALDIYVEKVNQYSTVKISKNAVKNKSPMYQDVKDGPQQIGYVITGNTLFSDEDKFVSKYINLWIEINIISYPDFNEP